MIRPDHSPQPAPFKIELMDPARFAVIQPEEIDHTYRLHHLGTIASYFAQYQESLMENNSDYGKIFPLLKKFDEALPASDKSLSDSQRAEISKIIAKHETGKMLAALKKGNRTRAEYLGDSGEKATVYQQRLAQVLIELLSIPAQAKVQLSFEADAVCQIIQNGKKTEGHCDSDAVSRDDMSYWYALNREASYLLKTNNPQSEKIGLVDLGGHRFGIWIEASLLRTPNFLGAVFESFLAIIGK